MTTLTDTAPTALRQVYLETIDTVAEQSASSSSRSPE